MIITHSLNKVTAVIVLMTAYAVMSTPALSQDTQEEESSSFLEEVVVTARKREETLMNIPTAVTVFSFDEMDRRGIHSLEAVSDYTAGMYFSNQGGQIPGRYNEAVRFRGMDTNQSAPSQQIATVFIDGVYFPGGIQGVDFSNVERVESIKGPQSATFGRSTFAGAVNIITIIPGFEYKGRFEAGIAEYGSYDTSFSHEGPLVSDKLAYRVSVRQRGTDGQYRSNTDGGKLGEERTTTFMGTLYFQGAENFSARLRGMFSKDDDGPPAALFFGGPGSLDGTGGADAGTNCFEVRPEERANGAVANYYCGELPDVNVDEFITLNTSLTPFARDAFAAPTFTPASDGIERLKVTGVPTVNSPGLKRDMSNFALNLDYVFNDGMLDDYLLSSLSGYGLTEANWVRDVDLTGFDASMSQDPSRYEFWSQELRITSPGDNRFRWSLGYSYFKADFIRHGSLGMSVSGLDAPCTNVPGGDCLPPPQVGGFTEFPKEGGETQGIFGSFGFDFTERLTLDFEWRYQDDEVTNDDRTTPELDFEDSFTAFLPRVTLSFHPVNNSTMWATYSEGNMPGFFNNEFVPLSEAERQRVRDVAGQVELFNSEESLEAYEIGWKQTILGGRLWYSLVAYDMQWDDLKTRQSVPIILDNGAQRALNVQFNAGNAKLKGIELEGGFAIGDHITGQFSAEVTDAEYGKLTCSFSPFKAPITPGDTFGVRDCSGSTPARYPTSSASIGLAWTDAFGSSGIWNYFIRTDGTYMGKTYSEAANFAWYGKFWRFNLRGGFERENLRLEAFVKNLFDDDHYLSGARWSDFSTGINFGFLFNQGVAITPASKRTVGLKMVYEF